MLTCLCVVHWNERHLPRGRAAAYRAVVKWLLLAREETREKEGGRSDLRSARTGAWRWR